MLVRAETYRGILTVSTHTSNASQFHLGLKDYMNIDICIVWPDDLALDGLFKYALLWIFPTRRTALRTMKPDVAALFPF